MSEQYKFRNKSISAVLLITFLLFCFFNLEFFTLNLGNEKKSDRKIFQKTNLKSSIISERIIIANNWSAAELDGICTGSGNFTDPYVIQDLVIDGGGTGIGISISSRNDYFRIENCTIFNCSVGIDLISTDNGTLYDNDCSFNEIGIYLHCPNPPSPEEIGCFNNFIIDNIVNNNSMQGIYIGWFCEDTFIINNTANNNADYGINYEAYPETIISGNIANNNRFGLRIIASGNKSELSKNIALNNEYYGIYCRYLSGWILTENIMEGSGLGYYQTSTIEEMSQMSIDTSNTVNGGPIYFYVNETDLAPNDFLNAGQIILGNCTDVLIKDVDVSNSTNGISIHHSSNVVIENCVSSNNEYGIHLRYTNNSSIIGNVFVKNLENRMIGINNTITRNYISNHHFGLNFLYSDNNTITDNKLIKSDVGIRFMLMNNYNTISGNILKDNIGHGISMVGNGHNLFYENFFRNNSWHADDSGIDNKWNNTQIGNYWDDYNGTDADNNGIGDIPYNVSESPLIQDFLPIVDNDVPEIIILSPSNNSVFGSTAPSFNVTVKERFIDEIWYTFDSGIYNYTLTENGTIDQTIWETVPSGIINLTFYVSDKPGKIGSAEVSIVKDVQAPSINITSPTSGDIFGKNAPSFNITIKDDHLDTMWYTLNNGSTKHFFISNSTIEQTAWSALPKGSVTIVFFANDTVGNLAFKEITIYKRISNQDTLLIIILSTVFGTVGIISVAIILLLRKRFKLRD